jgi:tight adherence protein C
MTLLLILSLALTVSLAVIVIAELLPARSRVVDERLADIEALGGNPNTSLQKRRRLLQGEWIMAILQELGARLRPGRDGTTSDTQMLVQAGYRRTGAVAIYWGLRLALAAAVGLSAMAMLPALGLPASLVLFIAVYFAGIGYILPYLRVRQQRRARQKEIQLALADTLDLLVVCVEAGLGLNQALVRVADEIRYISMLMSHELLYANAEIRAGTPRDAALRNLADRTGVEDLSSLVTMLIQTDRFGTSVARSLRVQSDVLRQKRRQRAEEAAAKTAIKMVFPLVFCIFPALFVVILGPGMIQIIRTLSSLSG